MRQALASGSLVAYRFVQESCGAPAIERQFQGKEMEGAVKRGDVVFLRVVLEGFDTKRDGLPVAAIEAALKSDRPACVEELLQTFNGQPMDTLGSCFEVAGQCGHPAGTRAFLRVLAERGGAIRQDILLQVFAQASQRHDEATARVVLAAGLDPRYVVKVYEGRRNALSYAVQGGLVELSRELLALGVQMLPDGDTTNAPIAMAAQAGNIELVQMLLAAGSPVDTVPALSRLPSPLQLAIAASSLPLVVMLLDAGAEVERECGKGSPLQVALENDVSSVRPAERQQRLGIVRELIRRGASLGYQQRLLHRICQMAGLSRSALTGDLVVSDPRDLVMARSILDLLRARNLPRTSVESSRN
jgi:hypothetical protein